MSQSCFCSIFVVLCFVFWTGLHIYAHKTLKSGASITKDWRSHAKTHITEILEILHNRGPFNLMLLFLGLYWSAIFLEDEQWLLHLPVSLQLCAFPLYIRCKLPDSVNDGDVAPLLCIYHWMPYSSVEIKEWHLDFPNQQDMYNSVYLRGWRKSSSPRILNLLLLQSKHIIFFEINGKIKIKSASVLLWISFRSRLSNYIHTINARRFKIVTFHLISLSCSPPTTTHACTCTHMPRCDEQASSMIVAQKTWFIQQTWSFYSFCSSLFIGNAQETLKVAAFVGLRRAGRKCCL